MNPRRCERALGGRCDRQQTVPALIRHAGKQKAGDAAFIGFGDMARQILPHCGVIEMNVGIEQKRRIRHGNES
jgi:hypothetical protein